MMHMNHESPTVVVQFAKLSFPNYRTSDFQFKYFYTICTSTLTAQLENNMSTLLTGDGKKRGTHIMSKDSCK